MGIIKLAAEIVQLKITIIKRESDLWLYWDWKKTDELKKEYQHKLRQFLACIF